MKRLCVISCIVLAFASCDLFQLQIQPRDNAKDPGSSEAVLYVLSVSPADGTSAVDTDSLSIIIRFSDSLDTDTMAPGCISLTDGISTLAGSVDVEDDLAYFSPDRPLNGATEYTVSLSESICSTSGASLEGSFSFLFFTRERQWYDPVNVEYSLTNQAQSPKVAMNNCGDAIVVWKQFDGSIYSLLSNSYRNGDGWSSGSTEIEDYTGTVDTPHVTISDAGYALAVWDQREDVSHYICANTWTAGSGWDTALKLEAVSSQGYNPRVSMNDTGKALVVWEQQADSVWNVWARQYVSTTGTWEITDENIDGQGLEAVYPQVAVDNAGNGIVVWQQDSGSGYKIWANRYVAGAGWSSALEIGGTEADSSETPKLAMNDAGDAIVVWSQTEGTSTDIWATMFSDGEWTASQRIHDYDLADLSHPVPAINADGTAFVVWERYYSSVYSVWGNRYDETGWGIAAALDESEHNAEFPGVSVDMAGNAIAVWKQSDGSVYSICARIYTDGVGWGPVTSLEPAGEGNSSAPEIDADDAGNAVVVWSRNDGGINSVYAAHYR